MTDAVYEYGICPTNLLTRDWGAWLAAARAGELSARNVANILWALAKLGHRPKEAVLATCAARAAARAHEANAQNIANTLWAFATLGAPWDLPAAGSVVTDQGSESKAM